MSLSAFLRKSPALRKALEGAGPFSSVFHYTLDDLLFIRDNSEEIWDYLVRKDLTLQLYLSAALANRDARMNCMSYSWVVRPINLSMEQEIEFCLPLIKHAITVLYCVLGRTSATEFIEGAGLKDCIVGNVSAVEWIAECTKLGQKEIECWQISAIANLIGILAINNFPKMYYTGAFRYLGALEVPDKLMRDELLPRLKNIFEINAPKVVH